MFTGKKYCIQRTQGDPISLFRITNCRINSGEHELYAIHSFDDDVCFDNSRTGFYNLGIFFLLLLFQNP